MTTELPEVDWKKELPEQLFEYLKRCNLEPTDFQKNVIVIMLRNGMNKHSNYAMTTAREQGVEGERAYLISAIKQVCEVHGYLDNKTRDKVIRFIENHDKQEATISLTPEQEKEK